MAHDSTGSVILSLISESYACYLCNIQQKSIDPVKFCKNHFYDQILKKDIDSEWGGENIVLKHKTIFGEELLHLKQELGKKTNFTTNLSTNEIIETFEHGTIRKTRGNVSLEPITIQVPNITYTILLHENKLVSCIKELNGGDFMELIPPTDGKFIRYDVNGCVLEETYYEDGNPYRHTVVSGTSVQIIYTLVDNKVIKVEEEIILDGKVNLFDITEKYKGVHQSN